MISLHQLSEKSERTMFQGKYLGIASAHCVVDCAADAERESRSRDLQLSLAKRAGLALEGASRPL